jgi:hypothetical protein
VSERMTDISAGDGTPGYMDYGRKSRAEMIAAYRRVYEHQRAEAERALAVPDDELVVTTFLGVHVQRNREVVS